MVTPRRSHPVAPLYHRPDSGYTNAEIDALIAGVGGGGPHDLDSHTDVDTTGVASGDVLTYDGADWVPQAPAAGGVSSFIARTGAVVAVAGDYDAFYYTEAEVDALIASFVDGSGTATFIPRWTDADTLADSVLEDLSSAGNSIMRISSAAGVSQLYLDSPAAQVRDIVYSTAGSPRWIFRVDLTAESGGNAGSNFTIVRRADDGSDLGPVFAMLRSNGQAAFYGHVLPNTTNAQDLGATANAWRSGYFGTSVIVNGVTRINTTQPAWGTALTAVSRIALPAAATAAQVRDCLGTLLNDLQTIGILA